MKKKVLVGMCGLFLMGCGAENVEQIIDPASGKETAQDLAEFLKLDPKKTKIIKDKQHKLTIYKLSDGTEIIENDKESGEISVVHLSCNTEDEALEMIDKLNLPVKKEFERYAEEMNGDNDSVCEPKKLSPKNCDYKILLRRVDGNYGISLMYKDKVF